jgi:hypothetical protein
MNVDGDGPSAVALAQAKPLVPGYLDARSTCGMTLLHRPCAW